MIYLIFGVCSLIGYVIFDVLYPKPKQQLANPFELNNDIIRGTNFIRKLPKVDISEKHTTYKFKCRIAPNMARLASGKKVPMKVSDDLMIRTFTIGVDPQDNCVEFVYLGPDQYHCDLDPQSKCLCIQNLLIVGICLSADLLFEKMDSYRE